MIRRIEFLFVIIIIIYIYVIIVFDAAAPLSIGPLHNEIES